MASCTAVIMMPFMIKHETGWLKSVQRSNCTGRHKDRRVYRRRVPAFSLYAALASAAVDRALEFAAADELGEHELLIDRHAARIKAERRLIAHHPGLGQDHIAHAHAGGHRL